MLCTKFSGAETDNWNFMPKISTETFNFQNSKQNYEIQNWLSNSFRINIERHNAARDHTKPSHSLGMLTGPPKVCFVCLMASSIALVARLGPAPCWRPMTSWVWSSAMPSFASHAISQTNSTTHQNIFCIFIPENSSIYSLKHAIPEIHEAFNISSCISTLSLL